jgi:integrase
VTERIDIFGDGRAVIYCGDCRAVMAAMPADSVDSVICDPPYGLAFMGKAWDNAVPGPDYWRAARSSASRATRHSPRSPAAASAPPCRRSLRKANSMPSLDIAHPPVHTLRPGSGEGPELLFRVYKMRRRNRRGRPWLLWWQDPPRNPCAPAGEPVPKARYRTHQIGRMSEVLAERHREAMQADLNGFRDAEDGGRVRWQDFAARYLESASADLSPASLAVARQVLARFAHIVRPRFLEDVTRADVDRYRVARRRTVARTTAAKDLRTLAAALAWAVEVAEMIPANPVGRLRGHGRDAAPEPDAMAEAETRAFLAALAKEPTWVQASLRLACLWGPRAGELAGIERHDIDFRGGTIRVPQGAGRSTKERRGKTVPADDETMGLLQEISHVSGPVLWGPREKRHSSAGAYLADLRARCRRLLAAVGVRRRIGSSPRDDKPLQFLRRTAETGMRRRGVPDWMIGVILGHGTRVGEQFYNGLAPAEVAAQVAQMMRTASKQGE